MIDVYLSALVLTITVLLIAVVANELFAPAPMYLPDPCGEFDD